MWLWTVSCLLLSYGFLSLSTPSSDSQDMLSHATDLEVAVEQALETRPRRRAAHKEGQRATKTGSQRQQTAGSKRQRQQNPTSSRQQRVSPTKIPKLSLQQDTLNIPADKPLVVGLYTGLPAETDKGGLKMFVESLRVNNKECSVVILTDQEPEESVKELAEKHDLQFSTFISSLDYMIARFYAISLLLKDHELNDDQPILIADMNDVIFQADPFKIDLPAGQLYAAPEVNNIDTMANPSSNQNVDWLRGCGWDPALLPLTGNVPVLCAGTILGRKNEVNEFLNWYAKKEWEGNDQGCWQLYALTFPNRVTIPGHAEKEILTFDQVDITKQKKDDKGLLLNGNGEPFKILHQVDRCLGTVQGNKSPCQDCCKFVTSDGSQVKLYPLTVNMDLVDIDKQQGKDGDSQTTMP